MHKAAAAARPPNSMRMFLMGVEAGKPRTVAPAASPNGSTRATAAASSAPARTCTHPTSRSMAGGAGDRRHLYHRPRRQPAAAGLCACQRILGPCDGARQLSMAGPFQASPGVDRSRAAVRRTAPAMCAAPAGSCATARAIWEKPFLSGEANMSHSIANLEHHHFKYGLCRRPGDVHVHFFGTATLSFADGVTRAGRATCSRSRRAFPTPIAQSADEGRRLRREGNAALML